MTQFHVGQLIVCIYPGPWINRPEFQYPVKGRIYTIRDIVIGRLYGAQVGIRLEEILNAINNGADGWAVAEPVFMSDCFRPVKTTSIEIFRALVAPITDKVRA